MNYYGKKSNKFTDLEKELSYVDTLLCTSMIMNLKGEMLLGNFPETTSGTHEDISEKFSIRTTIVCKILNVSETDKDSVRVINLSPYNIRKFGIDFTTFMGNPYDVFYNYCLKVREEEEVEVG